MPKALCSGISMLGKYQNMGKSKPYLIFGLTDETFSVVCNEKVPEGMPEEKTYLLLTFLDQCYWVLGTLIGAAAGSVITFNTEGLDFALTALFIVIFTEQWMSQKKHGPAVAGVVCSVLCLNIFGQDAFIIPAMIAILGVVSAGYKKEGRKEK
ncbi:AzlC family ABC transporter permease [[Clostridium] symbiosum]|uniref:AzlC family ABC transporter permease n=1 Tax=Clostridium symbiosum TaxID=1512 RepID=UPI0034B837B1